MVKYYLEKYMIFILDYLSEKAKIVIIKIETSNRKPQNDVHHNESLQDKSSLSHGFVNEYTIKPVGNVNKI